MRLKEYIDRLLSHQDSVIATLGRKLDDYFRNFDLSRNPSVNPQTQLNSLIEAQSLIQKEKQLIKAANRQLPKQSKIPVNKLNAAFLEEYALNLLSFLIWNSLNYNSLVITLDAEIPLWEGYTWKNGCPVHETAVWRPDIAIGRYFEDQERSVLNKGHREFFQKAEWDGVFIPLVVVSCKYRVSAAEFYDTHARFEILRNTSPFTLAVELANKCLIANAHTARRRIYFLELGNEMVGSFIEDVQEHLDRYMKL
ncbi:MAG: hypothetical protein ACFFCO_07475 [Promethearchaeota archaeon]